MQSVVMRHSLGFPKIRGTFKGGYEGCVSYIRPYNEDYSNYCGVYIIGVWSILLQKSGVNGLRSCINVIVPLPTQITRTLATSKLI